MSIPGVRTAEVRGGTRQHLAAWRGAALRPW